MLTGDPMTWPMHLSVFFFLDVNNNNFRQEWFTTERKMNLNYAIQRVTDKRKKKSWRTIKNNSESLMKRNIISKTKMDFRQKMRIFVDEIARFHGLLLAMTSHPIGFCIAAIPVVWPIVHDESATNWLVHGTIQMVITRFSCKSSIFRFFTVFFP